MNKIRVLLFLGIFMILLPYLGFPRSWKDIFFSIFGIIIFYIGFISYREQKEKFSISKSFDSFKENNFFHNNEE
jgi:hypothetical protein